MEFLTGTKIPVGIWARQVVDWLTENAGWFFDALASVLEFLIDGLLAILNWPHPLIVVALFTALAWYLRRSWQVPTLTAIGFLFIINQG